MLSSIAFLILPLIASCNPLELQPRGSCNADNCLRQLRGTPKNLQASPYCSSYYTSFVSHTLKVFISWWRNSTTTATTVTTVPALGATFPGAKKRTAEENLMKRTTATPTFVSRCTQAPTALSSGCSCLLGTAAAVSFLICLHSPHPPINIS